MMEASLCYPCDAFPCCQCLFPMLLRIANAHLACPVKVTAVYVKRGWQNIFHN